MKKLFIFILTLLLLTPFLKSTDALGYGFLRNKNHEPIDPGSKVSKIIKENNGYYLGDTNNKEVYLTFDCGYENGYTNIILETLWNNRVPAAFFVTGHYIDSASDLVLRMEREGHLVCNHTNKHKNITKLDSNGITKDIKELEEKYYKLTNKKLPSFYRPPEGEFDERSLKVVSSLGYKSIFWSVAYKDWEKNKSRGNDYAVKNVLDNIHPGAIILLHAVSKDNAYALDEIINRIKQEGYTFKSLNELPE